MHSDKSLRSPQSVLVAVLCLSVLLVTMAQAQGPDPVADLDQELTAATTSGSLAATGSTVLLPVLGYTPDTALMLGGTVLRFFYLEPDVPGTRPSVFSPLLIYTLKNQIMVYLGLELNWDQSRNTLNLVPSYVKFPDLFYGTGRDVSLDREEDYTSERIALDLDANRRIWRNWRLGLSYRIVKHRLIELDPTGQLASGDFNGTDQTLLSALGPTLALDSRDNTWAPDRGWWLQAEARFGGHSLGGDDTYAEYTLNLRHYWLVRDNLVLAAQILTTRLTGDPPFFLLPRLGGDMGLRGYRGSLYQDHTRSLARVELRRSRLWGPLGAVLFAGVGDVAPSPGKLTLSGELWSAGGGLRYLLDRKERVNVRLDIGFGHGDSGFFLSLGEAF